MIEKTKQTQAVLTAIAKNWPEASAEQAAIIVSIQRLARLFQRIAADALTSFNLTPTEFELLAALRAHPAPHRVIPSDLYTAMLMSSGGLTKLLKGMEARGLVSRPQSDGDRRVHPVQLTQTGYDLVDNAMQAVQSAEKPLIDAMNMVWPAGGNMHRDLLALVNAAEDTTPAPSGK